MHDLTTGSITRHLLKTASFMLVTMVFQTLYMLVDLYWVGHLGKEAVAGVSVAGNLMFIVLAVTQMLAVGTTTTVAHAAGQRDRALARSMFKQSLLLAAIVGGGFVVIAGISARAYVNVLAADAPTATAAIDYLRWFIPAMGLQFGIVAMTAALRATGLFKPGMIVQSATIIINVILAPMLMFGWPVGPALGVTGTAVATFVAVLVGTAWLSLYFLPQDAFLRFERGGWSPHPEAWRRMLSIGLPAGAEFALMGVYLFIVYGVSRPFGAAAQAGFGIGLRVFQALFMPIVALAMSAAAIAGQNVGAGKGDRVRQTFQVAEALAVGCALILVVLCHIAPAALVRVFSDDAQVVAVGEEYLRIVGWNFFAAAAVFVSASMFQAIGNTMPSLVASVARLVLIAVPVLWLSRLPGFDLRWVWYLTIAATAVQLVMSLALLKREFRLRLTFAGPDLARPAVVDTAIAGS
jgi:putative MATE family efflux protein